jgi:hypothetical protein
MKRASTSVMGQPSRQVAPLRPCRIFGNGHYAFVGKNPGF